jgi:hypothetical protein
MAVLMPLALVGCGGGSGSTDASGEVADSPAGAAIEAGSPAERKIGTEVQKYLERNCALPGAIEEVPGKYRDDPTYAAMLRDVEGMEAMCGHIAAIEVDGTRVTIRSEIPADGRRWAGVAFCNIIRGSDVADDTPGHELQNVDGSTIASCPVGDGPPEYP